LLQASEAHIPYVLVLADRTGADIHGDGRRTSVDTSVEGSQTEIERNQPGGWSQKRFQQRAIDSWKRNAAEVAEKVAEVAEQLSARLVLVGGDEHAVVPLVDALPKRWAPRVKLLEHATRAPGGDAAKLGDEVRRLVRTRWAEDEVALLRRFREEDGQHDKAANGSELVIKALQAAMVATLLVHDDEDDERTAWFGPDPTHVSIDAGDLEAMGVDDPREARLVDIVVRAAFGTGAVVRLVPVGTVRDGVGALLRASLSHTAAG
jgi:peptide subunit release factor 1 (eRF1)